MFDFGGGTLDVSIVSFGGQVCEVLATAGDDRLGGDDFDEVIARHLMEGLRAHCGRSVELSPTHHLVLRDAARRAKVELSTASTSRVYLPGFVSSGQRQYHLDVLLERSTFESLSSELLARAEKVLQSALSDSGGEALTDLLFIGGTSRIPRVRERVCRVTGLRPTAGVDPETSVAQGACLLAGVLAGEVRDLLLLDVVPGSYCFQTHGDQASPLIERNTTIPTRKGSTVTTVRDGQTEVTLRVLQGESPVASQNTFVGELRLSGIPPAPAGAAQVDVTLDIDGANNLTVSARDKATGHEVTVAMQAPYRLNPAQIRVLQRKVAQELELVRQRVTAEWERRLDEATRADALACAEEVPRFVARYGDALPVAEASLLAAGVSLIEDYLARSAPREDLQRLVSSLRLTCHRARLALAKRATESLVASAGFTQWLARAQEGWRSPRLLDETFRDLQASCGDEIGAIIALSRGDDASPGEHWWEELLLELRGTPKAGLALVMILGRSAGVHVRAKGLAISAHDQFLATIGLLGRLAQPQSPAARRSAASEFCAAHQGSECFFLLDYLAEDEDAEVRASLERCLEQIPVGSWLRRYQALPAEGQQPLVAVDVARRCLRRDAVHALRGGTSEEQDSALAVLEALGARDDLADLAGLLPLKLDEPVKVRLIAMLAASPQETAVPLLLVTLGDENAAARRAALVGLAPHRAAMAPDVRRFYELAERVMGQGRPLSPQDSLFLWRFGTRHRDLASAIDALKGTRPAKLRRLILQPTAWSEPVDTSWVDRWLERLGTCFDQVRRADWANFEPTPGFYARLESGDDPDLRAAVDDLGRHVGLASLPLVSYEWGLRMKPEVAGQLQYRSGVRSRIQIPLFYVGRALPLGAILAHELTHELLAGGRLECPTVAEGEQLTDLASIAIGFGKLVLNGTFVEVAPGTGEQQTLGYLSPELRVHAYRSINRRHGIAEATVKENLSPHALRLLSDLQR